MAIVEPGSGEAPEIEAGMYNLKIVSHEDSIREGTDEYGHTDSPIVKVNVAVLGTDDGEGNPIVLRSIMNRKWSPGGKYQPSTLYLYATAFGVASEPFDTDWLDGAEAQGMVRTEEPGKWPKIVTDSLIPAKKVNGAKAPTAAQEGAEPPLADALAEAAALADWMEQVKQVGYTTKEILDHSQAAYQRTPRELSAGEREELSKKLGV